jgi:hypothetical protein
VVAVLLVTIWIAVFFHTRRAEYVIEAVGQELNQAADSLRLGIVGGNHRSPNIGEAKGVTFDTRVELDRVRW